LNVTLQKYKLYQHIISPGEIFYKYLGNQDAYNAISFINKEGRTTMSAPDQHGKVVVPVTL
jgi:hypothetical protein